MAVLPLANIPTQCLACACLSTHVHRQRADSQQGSSCRPGALTLSSGLRHSQSCTWRLHPELNLEKGPNSHLVCLRELVQVSWHAQSPLGQQVHEFVQCGVQALLADEGQDSWQALVGYPVGAGRAAVLGGLLLKHLQVGLIRHVWTVEHGA